MPLLEVRDLHVGGPGDALVQGVDLDVAREARVAVLGASGSGKSLTVAAVLGLLPAALPARGHVRLDGVDVLPVPAARRPRCDRPGVVRQDSAGALHPLVPVGRQLSLPRSGSRRTVRDDVHATLRALGFPDPSRTADALPAELSGGQRQRVCLALALAAESPLLVADEPTTALDVLTQAGVLDLLRARTGPGTGRSLLFVTHDVAVAAALCGEVVVLDAGRTVEHGTMAQVLHDPRTAPTRALVGAARVLDGHLAAARSGAVAVGA